jgi:hypothetical protein
VARDSKDILSKEPEEYDDDEEEEDAAAAAAAEEEEELSGSEEEEQARQQGSSGSSKQPPSGWHGGKHSGSGLNSSLVYTRSSGSSSSSAAVPKAAAEPADAFAPPVRPSSSSSSSGSSSSSSRGHVAHSKQVPSHYLGRRGLQSSSGMAGDLDPEHRGSATGSSEAYLAGASAQGAARKEAMARFAEARGAVVRSTVAGTLQLDPAETASYGLLTKLREGHSLGVHSCAWAEDGRHVASCSHDGSVLVWDTHTCSVRRSYVGHSGPVHQVRRRRRSSCALWQLCGPSCILFCLSLLTLRHPPALLPPTPFLSSSCCCCCFLLLPAPLCPGVLLSPGRQ